SYSGVGLNCRLHVGFCVWGLFFHPPVYISNHVCFFEIKCT
ncbi:unnamed protein product, partial [Brassica oleracea var. botrytis]